MFFSSGRKLYHSPFPQVDTIGEKWFTDKGSKARKRVKKCDKGAIFFLNFVTVSTYLLLLRVRLG